MANFFPIQTNFGGGVLSKRLWARTDAPVYQKGLESCENWTVYPQGSLHRRAGFAYVADSLATLSAPIVRLIEMPSRKKMYVIELTPGKLRLFDNNGLVHIDNPQVIENNLFQRGLAAWSTFNCAANPQVAGVSVTYPGTQPANQGWIRQNLARRGLLKASTTYTLNSTFAGVFGSFIAQVRIVNNDTQADIAAVEYRSFGTFNLDFTTPATLPAAGIDIFVKNVQSNSSFLWEHPTVRVKNATPVTSFDTPWTTEEQIEAIQTGFSATTDEVFFVNQIDPVYHILHPDVLTEGFAFSAVTFVSPPPEWGIGDYPGSVEVYQGRLFLAGSPSNPNQVWASKTNSLYDFSLGTQANADDALSLKIATQGGIQWLRAQRTLLTGTVLGEYVIASNGPAITPSDITVRQQSAFGSARVQPYNVADQVMFVSLDRRKVRAANYELTTNGWSAADLTFLSPEITRSQVKEITFARDPLEIILCTLTDGTLAACTYHKPSDTVAWHKVSTEGKILSMAFGFYSNGQVWAAIEREHGVYIERIGLDTGTLFSDCGGTYPILDDGTVTGLGRLEGQTVDITVGDPTLGFAVVPRQVVTGGMVTGLDPAIPLANVGLPYTATAVTLPMDGGNPGGSAQGVMKGRDRIFARIFESALPLINGVRAQDDRTPAQPMNTPESLRTGDTLLANLGVDRYAKVTLAQDLPASTQISGVFGRSQVNAL